MAGLVNTFVDRIAIRSRILRLPIFGELRTKSRHGRRLAFSHRPSLSAEAQALLKDVELQGCHTGNIFGLLSNVPKELLKHGKHASQVLDDLQNDLAESDAILQHMPSVYMLGLNPLLLDVAELYLGEPCYFLGICLKRERANMSRSGTRQWHMDIEDDRMLRLIIYLCDVDDSAGPFNYAPAAESSAACAALNYRSGYLSDEAFSTGMRNDKCRTATGPAGTLVAFDGTRIFHRAGRPVSKDRLSLSITYCSRHPRQILRAVRLHWKDRRRLLSEIDSRQRGCIPLARLV